MNEHLYTLEPYKGMSTRYHCPDCKKKDKTFVRYINTATGEHLSERVGRCNRETNCGYHYTPKQYFRDNNISGGAGAEKYYGMQSVRQKPKAPSFIRANIFMKSLNKYEANNFVQFLYSVFPPVITGQLIRRYFIGTSKHWKGATVFWQVDNSGRIRTGKIMLYNPATGKRIKEPYNYITWVHSVLKQPEFNLQQCLFGEHLLKSDPVKPVAIVESEKTAIIASAYMPQFIWLAVGSLSYLNMNICRILVGRKVVLYPDLKGYDRWAARAEELSATMKVSISDLLEKQAGDFERNAGYDLADYLLGYSYERWMEMSIAA